MDFVSCSQAARLSVVLLAALLATPAVPHEPPATDAITAVKRLYRENRWEEVIQVASSSGELSSELDLYRGLAFAQLGRWPEAQAAFATGRRKDPEDKRFLLELAGIAYRRNDFSLAKVELGRALSLDPHDSYARDFLGSIYLLEGNVEAALYHWNRIGKPFITDLRYEPQPRVRAVLLDRAFAFSPFQMLALDDLWTTEARIRNMGIFPRFRFELLPNEDESFTVTYRSVERNGWGSGVVGGFLSMLRELPYQTIRSEFYNLKRSSVNTRSMLRWDSQKRRVFTSVSAPLGQEPDRRIELHFDGRDENWDLSNAFQQAEAVPAIITLEKAEAGVDIRSVVNDRWSWTSGIAAAYRRSKNVSGFAPAMTPILADGMSLEHRAGLGFNVLRNPERRLTIDSAISSKFGKVFASRFGIFSGIKGSLDVRWLPLPRGDDFEMRSQLRVGGIAGVVPVDELFALGMERDNELWLRGHIGTKRGKKGHAPMGRQFVLWNWEIDKVVHQNAFLSVKVGPLFDAGRVADRFSDPGSKGWLWDAGVQCKMSVLDTLTIAVSFGKGLNSAGHAFFTSVSR